MDTFGEQLKHERESRKVALDEIARSTKIRVRYLQALEEGQHERLPGIVFAKGYIRAFAETIGADPDPLVAAYIEEQRSLGRLESEASQERVLEALATAVQDNPDPASRRMRSAVFGVAAIVLLGVIGWFGVRPMMQGDDDAGATATPAPQAATMAPVPTPVQTAPPVITRETPPATNEPDPVEIPVATVKDPPVETPIEANEPIETEKIAALTIPDHGVGTGVESRALVGESSRFETGTQVVFWTRVLGGESGRSVRHVWSYEGNVTGAVELSIDAAHWRTYSRQTLRRSGVWTVEAQDEGGNVLARQTFVAAPA